MWSEVVPLTFRHQSSDIDIDIRFAGDQYGEHGDGFPFMSTTLAHAFFPLKGGGTTLPGDVHINEYEQWTIKNSSPNGIFYLLVIAFVGYM